MVRLKEFIRQRPIRTISPLSSETVQPKSLGTKSYNDPEKGSKSARFPGAFSSSNKPQIDDKSCFENKSQKLQKVITPAKSKIFGAPPKTSNFVTTLSQLKTKSDLEVSKSFAQPAFDDGNSRSVRDEQFRGFSTHLQFNRMTLSLSWMVC